VSPDMLLTFTGTRLQLVGKESVPRCGSIRKDNGILTSTLTANMKNFTNDKQDIQWLSLDLQLVPCSGLILLKMAKHAVDCFKTSSSVHVWMQDLP